MGPTYDASTTARAVPAGPKSATKSFTKFDNILVSPSLRSSPNLQKWKNQRKNRPKVMKEVTQIKFDSQDFFSAVIKTCFTQVSKYNQVGLTNNYSLACAKNMNKKHRMILTNMFYSDTTVNVRKPSIRNRENAEIQTFDNSDFRRYFTSKMGTF